MSPRHPAIVRATHWTIAVATLALVVSGAAILLAHPRLYWGETGAVGTPALIDLPIPFLLGHSGWGRSLHFLAAWIAVVCGAVYVVYGVATRHFTRRVLPSRSDLAGSSLRRAISDHLRLTRPEASPGSCNTRQRLAYLVVVFLVGPLVVLSGLAFSPALASVIPAIPGMFGGQQSARTVHLFASGAVVIFLIVHVVMVWLTGFRVQMRVMLTGDRSIVRGARTWDPVQRTDQEPRTKGPGRRTTLIPKTLWSRPGGGSITTVGGDFMRTFAILTLALGLALASAACSGQEPGTLGAAAAHLKADTIASIAYSGTGKWFQFGQAPSPTLPWPAFDVSRFSAAVTYDAPAA